MDPWSSKAIAAIIIKSHDSWHFVSFLGATKPVTDICVDSITIFLAKIRSLEQISNPFVTPPPSSLAWESFNWKVVQQPSVSSFIHSLFGIDSGIHIYEDCWGIYLPRKSKNSISSPRSWSLWQLSGSTIVNTSAGRHHRYRGSQVPDDLGRMAMVRRRIRDIFSWK